MRSCTAGLFARNLAALLAAATLCIGASVAFAQEDDAKKPDGPVSFYRQVRPILQRRCSGCHQPSKKGGQLLLTTFAGFKVGGENGESFVVGKPDESLILDYISGDEPEMPLNADPLEKEQVELIARWIKEGAKDDTLPAAIDTITQANPPKYSSPPVITALAYSPDGKLLAASGFHETLLLDANSGSQVARLVGRAQRIESVAFSQDGKLLGVSGGTPALFGEVQFWDVATRKLISSTTLSNDTLFGAEFSADGTMFSFGAIDNRARVLNVKELKTIMRFDAHSDWVFDSTFSLKDDHLITVSRDMSMKLVIVKNAQMVDNITSITPGALKGGLLAVKRHPKREQVLAAGSDGQPNLYKIFRTRKRIIGDNFNHIRSYEKLPGRVFDLDFSGDGNLFVAGASTATAGSARIYTTGVYDEKTTNNGGGLQQTRVETTKRSAKKMLLHELPDVDGPVFSVAFRPDGKQVAIGGFSGTISLYDVTSGKLVKRFVPVEIIAPTTAAR